MAILSPWSLADLPERCRWSLALDIGEASIGWAVAEVDDQGLPVRVINTGVRLFPSAWDNENGTIKGHNTEDRRLRGQGQRQGHRAHRLAALARCFGRVLNRAPAAVKDLVAPAKGEKNDPWAALRLRSQAADTVLDSTEDLFRALHHMAAHRGIRLARHHWAKIYDPEAEADQTEDETARAAGHERSLRAHIGDYCRRHGVARATCGNVLWERTRTALEDRRQPISRARGSLAADQVLVPTRALVADEFDIIRATQEPAHPDLPWDTLRQLVVDQLPIPVPPAGQCLFLKPVQARDGAFQGTPLTEADLARGLSVDPLIETLRLRETIGNLRVLEQQEVKGRQVWRPRHLADQGLEHGELTESERQTLLTALVRATRATDGMISHARLRGLLDLPKGGCRFNVEEKTRNGGIKAAVTDPFMAEWFPGWHDHPLEARSLYVCDLMARTGESARILAYIAQGHHGIAPLATDRHGEFVTAFLESRVVEASRYSVSRRAAAAILAAWDRQPTAGYYHVVRDLFGFAPNELVVGDLVRARARLHGDLPSLLDASQRSGRPAARLACPLPSYVEVIPSQLLTTLARGHKGSGRTRLWTGNAGTHRILGEVRKTVNMVINRYGQRRRKGRVFDPLPSRITVELAREAKHGAVIRQQIENDNKARQNQRAAESKALDKFLADKKLTLGGLSRRAAILRHTLWERQKGHCPYCTCDQGTPQTPTLRPSDLFDEGLVEVDHVIERRLGGDGLNNLVLAHKTCNQNKGNRTPHEYLGRDILDTDVLHNIWHAEVKRRPGSRSTARAGKARSPREDKLFMDSIGWRFTEAARERAEERPERQGRRLLQDTARAARLARLYLAMAIMPDDSDRLGAAHAPAEEASVIHRAIARVTAVNGIVTATLRQRLLQQEKNRDNARHHAEDACLLLLAGPAVVQAFNTDAGRDTPTRDIPPADVEEVADATHLERRQQSSGRADYSLLDRVLSPLVARGRFLQPTNDWEWLLTERGTALQRSIRDLVAKAPISRRPERPPETGTPGPLHDEKPFARRTIRHDGQERELTFQRMGAHDLVGMTENAKPPFSDGELTAHPTPGAVVADLFADMIRERHDLALDPGEEYRGNWKSVRIAALARELAPMVADQIARLRELDTIKDKDLTSEQLTERTRLRQALPTRNLCSTKPAQAIRAREAEILRRVLTHPHWGPRGLRGLKLMTSKKINPVRIRENKRDAFGRPAPGADIWIRPNGNALSQIWRVTAVRNAQGQLVSLPKQILIAVEVSNLEYARLGTFDTASSGDLGNQPPNIRKDLGSLATIAKEKGGTPGNYLGSAMEAIIAKIQKSSKKFLRGIGDNWTIDGDCAELVAEIAKGDVLNYKGANLKVTSITLGEIHGIPCDYAKSPPREKEGCNELKKLYQRINRPVIQSKGFSIPIKDIHQTILKNQRNKKAIN